MSFCRVNGTVLHWTAAGPADAPTLVLLHALGCDVRIWDEMVPALSARHRVIRCDLRGHGLSDIGAGPFRIGDLAQDLAQTLDAIGVRDCAIVGLSVGGMVAQSFAAGWPDRVRSLVLCDTAARIGTADGWNARIAAVERDGLQAIADAVLERWFAPDFDARRPDDRAGWHNMLTRTPTAGYAAMCAAIRDADLTADAALIRTPCLCVVGDMDVSTPPDHVRATAALIAGARFEVIEGAGHLPCLERPGRLSELILEHIDA